MKQGDKILREPDSLLLEAIAELPPYNPIRERGTLEVILGKGVLSPDYFDGTSEYRIAVRLQKARKGDYAPNELVYLLHCSRHAEEYEIVREYKFRYGGLANLVLDRMREVFDDDSLTSETCEYFMDYTKLNGLFDEPISMKLRTNSSEILVPFLEGICTPYLYKPDIYRMDKPSKITPYTYYVHSLADIFYYTIVCAKMVYKSGAAIKRCETCGKLFFPRSASQKRCYFPHHDEVLGEYTCAEIPQIRRSREESKKRTYERKMHNLRNTCNQRTRKETSEEGKAWLKQFMTAHNKKRAEVKDDVWKYTLLVEFIEEYMKEHPFEDAKRSRKKAE